MPAVAVPAAKSSFTYWPTSASTVNTRNGDASFTVTLLTTTGRSSFANLAISAPVTTGVVGGVIVAGVVPVGLAAVNTVPAPSSKIVTMPA